ncbi:xin actin-binding repeat-containing protein 2-like [Xyrauchen texanus]|uniref:xin actin-binding repeat-containing protein 2-like n=1 Tax=Xyrauchen texanus TaxID=154827 RepID=UPI002242378F|nr:xin actin-binding repeat-containing protein 2-like [Xyrauchen texanus]
METQSGNGPEVLKEGEYARSSPLALRPADAKGDLEEDRCIEKFDIPLSSLKQIFEKPTVQHVEVRGSHLSTRKVADKYSGLEDKMSNQESNVGDSAGSTGVLPLGDTHTDGETVPLKQRLALYQAAITKEERSLSVVMDSSEPCYLPGGLASIKKQFESQELSSSSASQSTVTQYHYQQRQEVVSSSEVTVRSSAKESSTANAQVSLDEKIHQSVATSFGDHYEEKVMVVGGENLSKVSTQALKQQHEKSIEEATPPKHIKIDLDYNQFPWAPVNISSKTSATGSFETAAVTKTLQETSTSSVASSQNEPVEQFHQPVCTIHHLPFQVPGHCPSPKPTDQPTAAKYAVNKEQYSKQRNLYELKRLCKHIHPEVRKNLERDFFTEVTETEHTYTDSDEEVSRDVQQARFVFENSGSTSPGKCISPEREYLEWDEILKGEVQSMRWMFENKPLDTIKDGTPDEDEGKNIAQQEIIAGKDVRYNTWMFETQPMDSLGTEQKESAEHSGKLTELARGDVQTATWLFETQPLDSFSRIYQEDEQERQVICTKNIAGGDVKTARYLFETQHLDTLGHTETVDESHFLQLKSELEEVKGEVKKTTKMFETQPMCVIRGDSGEMLEITKVRREETEKGDVRTSRWLFETQPLDLISKDPTKVKLICGVSMKENYQGGVNRGRWLFETKTLDQIKDEELESTKTQEEITGADVRRHCMIFETQPMDKLKDNTNARPVSLEDIMGGDVNSARHLFETVPMENLKELLEVGKLTKVVASEEEKGDVRHQRWLFESRPLEQIREDKKEITRTVNLEDLEKGDVTNYKEIFETMDLSKCTDAQRIQVEGVTSGSVKSNKVFFESAPLYAVQDSSGHYHEVKTVRREEVVKGDVRSCKWMFETRPIDQFDESISKFQIIKGISKEEIQSGDVKTAKWLFETQPLDGIKYFSNLEEEDNRKNESIEIQRGDVKTCRWLFETQPMDVLYDKSEIKTEDTTDVQKGDVKTCTWLFETQTLDSIKDVSETILKTSTVNQEDVQGKDVRLVRFLFETENLENITDDRDHSGFKRITEIDIQSGDVSRMKYNFETHSSDIMTSTSEETMQKLKSHQAEEIQKGNVVSCTWMFENQPIDSIKENLEDSKEVRTVMDIQGGNVDKGRFIFETCSLDKIQEEASDTEISKLQSIIRKEIEKGDVKNYTMMFETQPLYAIKDKEGHFHEVTTVTKEEIMRGDVLGARWLFETKPLDSIRDIDEVYVIKSVTEEDVQKGDVSTARWRFETQPLDEITEDMKVTIKTVADIQGGDVKSNKQHFEMDDLSKKYVKTVSVSEIQRGNVRSSTWMFETHTIDKIRGEGSEYEEMEKVTHEEVVKGDVKQSVWLFEKEPLDRIKEIDGTENVISREEIPKADVKTTTWLFETTPLTEFNESSVERTEIIGKSIKATLEELYSQKMVESQGILIEADEIGDVRMAKYKLLNQETPEIQKEEVIHGDLNSIMMNLLNRREITERGITIDREERGNINLTVQQLFTQEKGGNVVKEEILRGDIQEAINNLLKQEGSAKSGILIQEDEKGNVRMTIYSLLNKEIGSSVEKEDIVRGNVRGTLHRLLGNADEKDLSSKISVGDSERGNVRFYSTCIESGALDYLRQLQIGADEIVEEKVKEKIIGGDIEQTKQILRRSQQIIGRTVAEDDIVPGDVHNTVQVFMMEPLVSLCNVQKEEIVKGDLRAALDSLSQAVNQCVVTEKEEIVKGDISTTLKSLEEVQNKLKEVEKPEIVPGDIRGALQSLEKSSSAKTEVVIEDLVPGDIKGTLKSLEIAKQAVKEVEKEEIVKGDIHTALLSLQEASTEKRAFQHQVSEQGDVKGTIQILLEPTSSPHMQRRPSTEGDIKSSMKSLCEQEQVQIEKEEVIKGDVQGTIKTLMRKKDQSSHKSKINPHRKGKAPKKNPVSPQSCEICECIAGHTTEEMSANPPPVKNIPQSCMQKTLEIKSSEIQTSSEEHCSTAKQMTIVGHSESSQGSQKIVNEQHIKQKENTPSSVLLKRKNFGGQMSEIKSESKTVSSATSASKEACSTAKQITIASQSESSQGSQIIVREQHIKQKENTPSPVLLKKKNFGGQMSEKKSESTTVSSATSASKEACSTAKQITIASQSESSQGSQKIVREQHIKQKENTPSPVLLKKKNFGGQMSEKKSESTTVSSATSASKDACSTAKQITIASQSESSQGSEKIVREQHIKQKENTPSPVLLKKKNFGGQMSEKKSESTTVSSATSASKEASQTHISIKQTQEKKTVTQVQTAVTTEHTTITQKQNTKNVKSEKNIKSLNCNLSSKGMIKKVKPHPEINFPPPPTSPPPPSESELSLPPPPSPVAESYLQPALLPQPPLFMRQDSDLPPPPPPPPIMEADTEFFPPPPPLQDLLPPPPSQQELSSITLGGKPKGQPLFKVPKPEPPKETQPPKYKWQKKQTAPAPPPPPPPPSVPEQGETVASNISTVTETTETVTKQKGLVKTIKPPAQSVTKASPVTPVPSTAAEETSRPKKIFVPPIKLPPPPEPAAPKPRPYASKFKTPLMLAEERYHKQREEVEKNQGECTPTSPPAMSPFKVSEMKAETESSTQEVEQSQSVHEQQEQANTPEPLQKPDVLPKYTAEKAGPPKSPQFPSKQNPLANFHINKPSFPKVGKKITTESSSVVSDKKQESVAASLEIKSHPAPIPEQVEGVKACLVQQESVQSSISLITASVQAEEIKSTKSCVAQEVKKVPTQPTKTPKVTPSFKVKTFKVETVEKQEGRKGTSQKEQTLRDAGTHNVSQVCMGQESFQKSSSDTEKTEVKVEKKEEVKQDNQDVKMEVKLKKQKQKSIKQLPPETPKPSFDIHQVQPSISMEVHQGERQTAFIQSHPTVREEHVQIHEKRMVNQSTVQQQSTQQKSQFQTKKHVKPPPRPLSREEAMQQSIQKEKHDKMETAESNGSESLTFTTESSHTQKCDEINKLLSYIKQLEEAPGKINPKTAKTMLSLVPDWLVGSEEKDNLNRIQFNKQKTREVMAYLQNLAQAKQIFLEGSLSVLEMPKSEPAEEKKIVGGATQKISKITIGSAKRDNQKKVVEEKKAEWQSESKTTELRMPPELRMQTPSPTFICIESAKRTDSPYRVTPSPPPYYKSCTIPTPPPRWSDTPTRLNQSSPSPTMSHSEKLAKLRDTTAKLSQGMTPPPMPLPEHMLKAQTDLEGSRSSSRSEISMETYMMESSLMDITEIHGDSIMTVKDKREFFEEAQKADINRTYVRKGPIDIPERLGPDAEDSELEIQRSIDVHDRMLDNLPRVDLSKLVNKFESPQPKMYARKEPVVIAERLESDTKEAETKKKPTLLEDIPNFDIKALKNVFEMGEQAHQHTREEKKFLEKHEESIAPTGFSEMRSVSEHFSTVDEFGNPVTGSKTEMTSHSQNVTTRCDPPTYADVVRRKVPVLDVPPEDSAEELLKSFQQTWAESENVFKKLGFSVSEQHRTQSVSHQHQTVVTENTSARVRTVSGMSEDSVSHGVSYSGQAKLP